MKLPLSPRRAARGFALVELFVGIMVLMTALSIALIACNQAVTGRHVREERDAAREAVQLSLERVRALNAAQLPAPGHSLDLGVPPALKRTLPDATCVLTIAAGPSAELLEARIELASPKLKPPESGTMTLRLEAPSAPSSPAPEGK